MARKRPIEQLVFLPDDVAPVLLRMDHLANAHDGWINLLPGMPEEVEEPSVGLFSGLFGSARPPVTMCTWIPGRAQTYGEGEATIGFMHPRGKHAACQLGSLGVDVPSTWRVRQDHVRRGLILSPLSGASNSEVLEWILRAGAALAMVPLTGFWQARIYLPRKG